MSSAFPPPAPVDHKYFQQRSEPETQGLPSRALASFLERLKDSDFGLHSLYLARNGHCMFSLDLPPLSPASLQRCFSISKSLVSLAIGCLQEEGQVELGLPVLDYFPEYEACVASEFQRHMTVEDLLSMRSCHRRTSYKAQPQEDWVASFFSCPPSQRPGTLFAYDSSASHCLAALVEKLSGQQLLDYLRERFLTALGFSSEAYFLQDPQGISMGASGLMARSTDLLKLGLALEAASSGLEGPALQRFPRSYLRQATQLVSPSLHAATTREESLGYGYQFWLCRHGGYACYGMGGQYILVYPSQRLVLSCTADNQGRRGQTQLLFDALYEEIFPALEDRPLPPCEAGRSRLEACLENWRLDQPGPASARLEPQKLSQLAIVWNRPYRISKSSDGLEALCFRRPEATAGQSPPAVLEVSYRGQSYCFPVSLESGCCLDFPRPGQLAQVTAWIPAPQHLALRLQVLAEALGSLLLLIRFRPGGLSLHLSKRLEYLYEDLPGVYEAQLEEAPN